MPIKFNFTTGSDLADKLVPGPAQIHIGMFTRPTAELEKEVKYLEERGYTLNTQTGELHLDGKVLETAHLLIKAGYKLKRDILANVPSDLMSCDADILLRRGRGAGKLLTIANGKRRVENLEFQESVHIPKGVLFSYTPVPEVSTNILMLTTAEKSLDQSLKVWTPWTEIPEWQKYFRDEAVKRIDCSDREDTESIISHCILHTRRYLNRWRATLFAVKGPEFTLSPLQGKYFMTKLRYITEKAEEQVKYFNATLKKETRKIFWEELVPIPHLDEISATVDKFYQLNPKSISEEEKQELFGEDGKRLLNEKSNYFI